ncbi:MAG: YfhO family protein [Planctomycetota bacterium]|nr:YfhO family protein [Planctomycetota bacterium]
MSLREKGLKFILAVSFIALLFGDILQPDFMIADQDAWHYYMPIKERIATVFNDPGQLFWEAAIDCGRPYLADPIAQALYPGNLLFLIFSGPWAWKLFVIAHMGIAILGFLRLAESFEIEKSGAFFGSLLFIGSGAVVSHHWSPIWWVGIACLPWAMAATRGLLHRDTGRWGVVKTAVPVTLMILGGAFEPLLAYIYYAAFEVFMKALNDRREILNGNAKLSRIRQFAPYLLLGCAAILSIALATAQLGPTFEFLSQCDRSKGSHPAQVYRWSLSYWRLSELFAPQVFGGQETGYYWMSLIDPSAPNSQPFLRGIYVGMPALMLAFQGFLSSPKKQRWILGLGLAVTLILAMGKFTPIFWIARQLAPGVNLFRYPEKITTIAMLFLSLLAARGFSSLFNDRTNLRRMGLVSTGLLLCSLGLFWWQSSSFMESFNSRFAELGQVTNTEEIHQLMMFALGWALGVTALFTGLLFIPLGNKKLKIAYSIVIVAFPLLDMANTNRHLKILVPLEALKSPPKELPEIEPGTRPRPRVATRQPCGFVRMVPQQASFFGFDSTDGYGSARLANRLRFDTCFGDELETKRLKCLGVNYTLERPRDLSKGYREVYGPRKVRVEPFTGSPRFRLMRRLFLAQRNKDQARLMRSKNFQVGTDLVTTTNEIEGGSFKDALESLTIEDLSSSYIRIKTDCSEKRYLLICDSYYPGWTATVDGEEAKIFEANLCFRAVSLEAGAHTIEWRYTPSHFWFYLLISGLAATVLVALSILHWRSKPHSEALSVEPSGELQAS